MKPMNQAPPLPANIEAQLSDLEARHKRHQALMEEQRIRKVDRRAAHRARHFERSIPPNTLI
jgi:hypothetical protein